MTPSVARLLARHPDAIIEPNGPGETTDPDEIPHWWAVYVDGHQIATGPTREIAIEHAEKLA